MVFTASLLGAQHQRDSVENRPASLLVVSLGKALNRMPPSSCDRQVLGQSSLPVVVAQSDERHANRARAHTHECINELNSSNTRATKKLGDCKITLRSLSQQSLWA